MENTIFCGYIFGAASEFLLNTITFLKLKLKNQAFYFFDLKITPNNYFDQPYTCVVYV
jgi:hypothetical protein